MPDPTAQRSTKLRSSRRWEASPNRPKHSPPANAIDQCDHPRHKISSSG